MIDDMLWAYFRVDHVDMPSTAKSKNPNPLRLGLTIFMTQEYSKHVWKYSLVI